MLKTCYFTACFTTLCTISEFYVNTARDVATVLYTFANCLLLHLPIFTCTYRGTHTQAHMYNQHTRGMETTRHRSLVERGGRKNLLETLHTHTHKKNVHIYIYIYLYLFQEQKPIFTNLKEKIRAHRASSKLLDYFLRSNKSNINLKRSFVPKI